MIHFEKDRPFYPCCSRKTNKIKIMPVVAAALSGIRPSLRI
jgi:hypothetical protein